MQYELFLIPLKSSEDSMEDLNRFLRSHAILTVHRETISENGVHYASFCVEYLPSKSPSAPFISAHSPSESGKSGKPKVDYKELLTEQEFTLYLKLRDLRKELATKDSIPVYAVFNNEQLAEMVRQKVTTKTALSSIAGIGEAKIDKYGARVLNLLTTAIPPTQAQPPDTTDKIPNTEQLPSPQPTPSTP